MQIKNQLSFSDVYENCKGLLNNKQSKFITLPENVIDIADFIPASFYSEFYRHFGRNRVYSLEAFISAMILQKIYSIPTDALPINILNLSK